MGRIFCVMGKSSSGKDTLYKHMMEHNKFQLNTIVPYTTRPIREGEQEGVEYHFCKEEDVRELERLGKIIELRSYDTVYGIWRYFTVDDEQIDLEKNNYLLIGTLESYEKMKAYFNDEVVVPIYIEIDDGIRLERALKREQMEAQPKYAEMCRRFLADEQDFSEEKLKAAKIEKRFYNHTLHELQAEVEKYIEICL